MVLWKRSLIYDNQPHGLHPFSNGQSQRRVQRADLVKFLRTFDESFKATFALYVKKQLESVSRVHLVRAVA